MAMNEFDPFDPEKHFVSTFGHQAPIDPINTRYTSFAE